jgi:hypothetical protein
MEENLQSSITKVLFRQSLFFSLLQKPWQQQTEAAPSCIHPFLDLRTDSVGGFWLEETIKHDKYTNIEVCPRKHNKIFQLFSKHKVFWSRMYLPVRSSNFSSLKHKSRKLKSPDVLGQKIRYNKRNNYLNMFQQKRQIFEDLLFISLHLLCVCTKSVLRMTIKKGIRYPILLCAMCLKRGTSALRTKGCVSSRLSSCLSRSSIIISMIVPWPRNI